MYGPTAKYRHLGKDPIDGVPITWSAHPDHYPTRQEHTPAFIEKQRRDQATEIYYARSVFLNLPADNEKYTEIIDWMVNGAASLRTEERREYVDADGKPAWLVWLVYFDIRGVIPKDNEMR